MMRYEDLIIQKENGICKIYINREDSRNSIRPKTWEELYQLVIELDNDKDIKVAILRGAGSKTFASGADLKEMQRRTAKDIMGSNAQNVLLKMEQSRVVYIAAINGFALGGGCEIALACDIRIASSNAKFGQPEVNLSLIPSAGGTQRLPRIVGEGMAKDMILSGKIIDTDEAYRIGLITEKCTVDVLDQVAERKALDIIDKGPLAIQMVKTIMNSNVASDTRGYMLEKLTQAFLLNSEDTKEGIQSFIEKRKPVYKGV
jgi:enoyl-CoA hydratase